MATTPCWNCSQPATHTLTRKGSNTLNACDNCTRIDRAEAESRGWTVAPITATVRELAEAKVQAMAATLTDEALRLAWMATETEPVTEELALTRGWLMDELERRMNALDARDAKSTYSFGQSVSRFDRWLFTDCEGANDPASYLI